MQTSGIRPDAQGLKASYFRTKGKVLLWKKVGMDPCPPVPNLFESGVLSGLFGGLARITAPWMFLAAAWMLTFILK